MCRQEIWGFRKMYQVHGAHSIDVQEVNRKRSLQQRAVKVRATATCGLRG